MSSGGAGSGGVGGRAGGRPSGLDRRHHGRQQRPGLRSGCAGGGGKRAPPPVGTGTPSAQSDGPGSMRTSASGSLPSDCLPIHRASQVHGTGQPAQPCGPRSRRNAESPILELRCNATIQVRSLLAQRTGSASLSSIQLRTLGGGCAHLQLGFGGSRLHCTRACVPDHHWERFMMRRRRCIWK